MYYYEKTILTCYKSITPITNQLENLIVKKAKNSFYDYTPCINLAENILKLVNARLDLLELKFLTEEGIKKLNEEDKILIEYKYFKIKPEFEIDTTSRKYFRHQVRALKRFGDAIRSLGVSEEYFKNKYLNINYINNVYKKIIKLDGKKLVSI